MIVVVVMMFAMNFAATRRKIRGPAASSGLIDSLPDWVLNIPISLAADNTLRVQ